MARNPRNDSPGSWHHVMNRGIAKRPLFEGVEDIRFFQSRLARAVRRGQLEVHAWCFLTTHYHLLVRSPAGELSAAMRRTQLDYSRRFNRGRRRDGPLVRGRFRSKQVSTCAYRRILVRYIDANPVRASLVSRSVDYPHGSAKWFARRSGPPWHHRSWVEEETCRVLQLASYDPLAYDQAFAGDKQTEIAYLVERRLDQSSVLGPGVDLFEMATGSTKEWMLRKAKLADGTTPGLAVAAPQSVKAAVAAAEAMRGSWRVRTGRQSQDGWLLMQVGLLRDLTGASWKEIGRLIGRSASNASGLCGQHVSLLRNDDEYADRAAEAADRVLSS